MIKAAGTTGDGRRLLVLGLSAENMTRLLLGQPIRLECAELGLPDLQVVVVGGQTEQDIADDLVGHGVVDAATVGLGGPDSPG